jgi:hypothetical protein
MTRAEATALAATGDWRKMTAAAIATLGDHHSTQDEILIADDLTRLAVNLQDAEERQMKLEAKRRASPWFKE